MPKPSRYNHFQRWDNGLYLAYNAGSGAVGLMTEQQFAEYEALITKLSGTESADLSPAERDLIKTLSYGRFLRPDHINEVEAIRFDHNRARYDQSSLGLVIAPTMACNMACRYCFEENKNGRMNEATMAALVAFVRERAAVLGSLDVTWYGGEPLLALDIIEKLTGEFLALAEEYKIAYTASVVTNGYLLTPEVVNRLRDWHVVSAQVTLDGPARLHNQKRPLKNGKASFTTIIKNMTYAAGHMGIGVRVNVDKDYTIETIGELLTELSATGLQQRVGIYFGLLEASATVCSNIAEACLETVEFSRVEIDFYRLLLQRGFRIDRLPSPSAAFCMAQMTSAFVADHEGYLYRCWNYVGDRSRAMGTVFEPVDFQHPNFTRLFAFDPTAHDTCTACNLLPLCMGGCPARRADRNLPEEALCDSWKYNLQPMLEIIAASRYQPAPSSEPVAQEQL
jgi:uncharacterized protein